MCKVKGQENFCEKEERKREKNVPVLAKCENIIINSKCKCSLMTLLCLYHPFLIWPIDNIYKFVFVTYERMLSAFNVVIEKWEQNSEIKWWRRRRRQRWWRWWWQKQKWFGKHQMGHDNSILDCTFAYNAWKTLDDNIAYLMIWNSVKYFCKALT